MFGYIYMFTNKENGKRYIGQHKSEEIDEKYFGSGKLFKNAKKKYGIENFKFDILTICDSQEELNMAEEYFIGFKYYTLKHTNRGYNISSGGNAGNNRAGKTKEELEEWNRKVSQSNIGRVVSEETKRKISQATQGENNPMYGRDMYHEKSEEEQKKMTEKRINTMRENGSLQGEKNPMYGVRGKDHPMYGQGDKLKGEKNGMYGRTGAKNHFSKKVICITTGEIYDSVTEAVKTTGVKNVSACCRGKRNYAGMTENGEKMIWMFYEDYLKRMA